MKRKIIAVMLAAALAGTLPGCSSGELSNEYVTVTQYKGLEVPQAEKSEVTDDQVEQAIQGTDCTFSAFVVAAVRSALESLSEKST